MTDELDLLPPALQRDATFWLQGKRPSTRRTYAADAAQLLELTGARSLRAIGPDELAAFEREIRERYGTHAAARKIAVVKSLFAYATRNGTLSRNPAIRLKTPEKRPRSVSERVPDLRTMIAAFARAHGRSAALVRLCYATGASAEDLARLRRRDVFAGVDGRGHVQIGRGHERIRQIAISPATYGALAPLLAGLEPNDRVFPGARGRQASTRTIEREIAAAGRELGLGRISARVLRNAHEAHALQRGAPPDVVAHTLRRAAMPRRRQKPKSWSSSTWLPI